MSRPGRLASAIAIWEEDLLMFRIFAFVSAGCWLLTFWCVPVAVGQGQPIFQEGGIVLPRESERKEIRTKGKIQGINGSVMQVVGEQAVPFLVKMPEEMRNIHLIGAAHPGWLKQGMLVRFIGEFDPAGKCQAPIRRLEVFTFRPPRPGDPVSQVGVFRLPAEAPVLQAKDEAARPAPMPAPNTARFRIVGQLGGFKNGQIAVAAGSTMVQATLAADAEIVVDVADYSLAKPGDEIEIEGWYYPQIRNRVTANRVTIQSVQVMGAVVRGDQPAETPAKPGAATPAAPAAKPPAEDLPF